MSLRQNALALAVLTVLMAIVGDWSGDPDLARLWYLALALLLLGLAYEGWLMMRTGLGVSISASKPRSILGRPAALQVTFRHRLARALTLEIAADSPGSISTARCDAVCRGRRGESSLTAITVPGRNLPPLRARVAGPLGLRGGRGNWLRSSHECRARLARRRRSRGRDGSGTRAGLLGRGGEVLKL